MTDGATMGQQEEQKEKTAEKADQEKRAIEIDVQDESHLLESKPDKKS